MFAICEHVFFALFYPSLFAGVFAGAGAVLKPGGTFHCLVVLLLLTARTRHVPFLSVGLCQERVGRQHVCAVIVTCVCVCVRAGACVCVKNKWQQCTGRLLTYGPYKVDGKFTTDSNKAFDTTLRGRNPLWGYRDVAECEAEAVKNGLQLKVSSIAPSLPPSFAPSFVRSLIRCCSADEFVFCASCCRLPLCPAKVRLLAWRTRVAVLCLVCATVCVQWC